ncbi:MAG TPA: hypothetical protein VF647_07290 [Longimicrobium sp.]|jgi:hypothetical protein
MLRTPFLPRPRRRHWKLLFFMFALLIPQLTVHSLSAQQIVVDPGNVEGQKPAACPGQAFWWDYRSIGNVDVDGYFFDANPFTLSRWTSQHTGIYSSTRGRRVVDMSGTKVWTDARANASCWDSSVGPIHIWWARWEGHLGTVEDVNAACEGGTGGNSVVTGPSDPGYDPSDPNGDGCGDGTGGQASGTQFQPGQATGGETVTWSGGVGNGGTSVCGSLAVVEYVCIDVWDEEAGWVEWDCGYATTC